MGMRDEGVDVCFIVGEEGIDVRLVQNACALSLRQDEVGEDKEAKVGVERKPMTRTGMVSKLAPGGGHSLPQLGGENAGGYTIPRKYKPGPRFNKGEAREYHPVHQPWCQLSGIGSTESFVGSEDGEKNSNKRSSTGVG